MTVTMIQRPWMNTPDLAWFRRFNWRWLLQRSPMVFLAVLSSWGVGGFIYQSGRVPIAVAILGSGAFDLVFLGAIALADQHLGQDRGSHILYWVLNVGAAILSALLNTLYYADGTYAGITAEAVTHGVPFSIFGLIYALYYHNVTSRAIEQEVRQQQSTAFKCKYCNNGFPSQAAMYGHYRRCEKRTV